MKSFWKLGISTVAIIVAGLGVAVILPAWDAQAAGAGPTTYRTAYATKFDPNTFTFTGVEIWQGPDPFSGETVTTLYVTSFGQGFASGSVVLQPGRYTLGTFSASVDGPITIDVVAFSSFCEPPTPGTVEVSDLTWSPPRARPLRRCFVRTGLRSTLCHAGCPGQARPPARSRPPV